MGGAALDAAHGPGFDVLVFSKTADFRHASIPAGIAAIESLGAAHGFAVDATEDAGVFTPEGLAPYEAVVFLSTTGDVLDDAEQAAFEKFIEGGRGFVGIHSAADTEYDWPWYGRLLGAYFLRHPAVQQADVVREDPLHQSTRALPETWMRTDEWYNFRTDPRRVAHVLLTVDEASYNPGKGAMGRDHPVAWCHEFDGGRAWYTALGHTPGTYSEPLFRKHLLGGIRFAAGRPRSTTTRGSPRSDAIACTPGADVVFAGGGNDRVDTGGGPDRLVGGGGSDRLKAGPGSDRLFGGGGSDRLEARDGVRDELSCGRGRDVAIVDRRDRIRSGCETVRRG
jgi:type 1 glutamine amidotransferase